MADIRFQVRGVSKFYQRKNRWGQKTQSPVLQQLDVDIFGGQINVLTGDSGCGKTTLAKLLMRLETPDQGEILYLHHPLHQSPLQEFRRKNQMMFQSPTLSVNPCFTIRKIIVEPLSINKKYLRGRENTPMEEVLKDLMDLVKLPLPYLQKYPGQLSGGELQRVVLARVLILKPEFIVLDEPLSAVDELTAHSLIDLFKPIFRQFNMGALWITHSLHQVESLVDHLIVLKPQEKERGGKDELLMVN